MSKKSLLCLKCRGTGHIASKCKQEYDGDYYDWFVSSERASFETDFAKSNQRLCKRCSDLDLVHLLEQDIPWETALERGEHHKWGTYTRNLGKAGKVRFRKDCPLCRCLFALTPTPESDDQHILMLPNWNMNRLEGGVAMNTPEKRRSARGILLTLARPDDVDFSKDSILDRGDCLTIVQEDLSDKKCALGGRRIASTINFDLIHQWLAGCSRLHPITCMPMWNEGLRMIRLVDVDARAVVHHPGTPCDYIALSYVLGGVDQIVCKPGPLPERLPPTIEDSINLVRRLGKRYLWVDTLCIDQSESKEKYGQINKMDIIYRGAYATVVSLSGTSADSGLPRLSRHARCTPQLSCRIGGKTLVTLMPTLSQQIFTCSWGTRAWTLQEALLSRRCIYLSDQQMYFECNAMQCCESIDESHSWIHNSLRDTQFLVDGHLEPVVGAGVLRSPFTGTSKSIGSDRLQMYIVLTNLYNYRYMTYQSDALNAFSGILQYLNEVAYPRGFFWGLPLEDFNWALSWVSRGAVERRNGFPSWSWAGWQGRKWGGEVFDTRNPHKWSTFLHVLKLSCGELQPLFKAEHHLQEVDSGTVDAPDDHLLRAARTSLPPSQPQSNHESLNAQLLVIEGITLTFHPDCSDACDYDADGYVYYEQVIQRPGDDVYPVYCLLHALGYDEELERLSAVHAPHSFLLLGRQRHQGWEWFTLMALKVLTERGEADPNQEEQNPEGKRYMEVDTGGNERMERPDSQTEIMTRGTVVHLMVPEEDISRVMLVLRPEKKRIFLA
ncbi:hypothetical protein PV04_05315 [Phialophora macrospora]|uniref:Heterokaryon incompatibility domain-containing protein n=1 Tax=Phialophora macrospora TaxID=1851006 RepID=A0A0D2FMQ5_9EURO|nr:hypothetical protein PV04_05315 [Phialophora macrospora]